MSEEKKEAQHKYVYQFAIKFADDWQVYLYWAYMNLQEVNKMIFEVDQVYQAGDKAMYPMESAGKTYFAIVKIEDVLRIDKLVDDTYRVHYNVLVYYSPTDGSMNSGILKTLTVEESKLISIEDFNNKIIALF